MENRQDDPADEIRMLRERIRSLEDELRMRDEFIIAAAHELRNPISPLALHVQRLLGAARTACDDHISAKWLGDQLDTFSHRLMRFMSALNRILDVSRMRGGSIELVLEPVELCEVTRDVINSFERELAASRSVLSFAPCGPVQGMWDRMRLEQVVSNLISNAIRYGHSEPISVSITRTDDSAVLIVSDRGVGIPPEDHERIFERFERANTTNRAGFGVGLWVVRQLCRAMGGDVRVDSRPGEGSTFTVTLPRQTDGSGDAR